MLVVTRKRQQSVLLSGGIRFTVIGIESGKVKIGIECPDEIKIWRDEVAPAEFMVEFQCDKKKIQ